MSVAGYFEKSGNGGERKKGSNVGGEGPVLQGEQAAEAALREDAEKALKPGKERFYQSVAEYDAVLRGHCRL